MAEELRSATLKERLTETSRNVDRWLARLLDHEKRLIRIEATGEALHGASRQPRLPRGE